MIRNKVVLYNVLAAAAGCWFLLEAGRAVLSIVRQYRLEQEAGAVFLPSTRGVRWPLDSAVANDRDRTVVLALSPDLKDCNDGVSFYKKLITMARSSSANFGVFVLLERGAPNIESTEALGAVKGQVAKVDLRSAGVRTTPILWVIQKNREVSEVVLGCSSAVEHGYIAGLAVGRIPPAENRAGPEIPFELSTEVLTTVRTTTAVQIVDVQNRENYQLQHEPTSLNIPSDELFVRARSELSTAPWTIVDCTYIDPRICDFGAYSLGAVGFTRVSVLNRGATPMAQCPPSKISKTAR